MKWGSKPAVLTSIILAMLVASIDTTILNITMPVIVGDLGGFRLYAWSFASYMILATVTSPLAGRISDLYGRKKIFSIGIAIFIIGSLLCGLSTSMLQLVLFRAIQGLGAGIMLPFPAIIASDLFRIEQRAKIQAAFNAMWGLSALIAPLIGGLLTEYASWRWIFYINLPIGLISIICLLAYKDTYEPKRAPVDVVGGLLFASAISLLLSLTVVEAYYVPIAIGGAILLLFFAFYERRVPAPLIPFELIKDRPVALMIIHSFIACAALFGSSSYIPLYLQERGYSVLMSGWVLVGMSVGWTAVGAPSGGWVLRWGYRRLLVIGSLFMIASAAMLAFLQENTYYWYVLIAMVLQGIAFGLIMTVSLLSVQHLVSGQQKGVATSVLMFARNTGTAISVTVMGAILNSSAVFFTGIQNLFWYGTILGVVSLLVALVLPKTALETFAPKGS